MLSNLKDTVRELRAHIYARVRPANVCMLHIGRCGSTVLANMLKQHPNIDWVGEFFNDSRLPRFLDIYDTTNSWKALRLRSGIAGQRIFGFEVKAHPVLHPAKLGESLHETIDRTYHLGCRHYILLTRTHLLRRFVSYFVGRKRDQWTFARDEVPGKITVRVPVVPFQFGSQKATLIEFFDMFDGIADQWRDNIPNDCKVIELEYASDILDNPRNAYGRVTEWLEVDEFETQIKDRKVGTAPLKSFVENWKEVVHMLEGTRYEWMLSDEIGK